MKLILYRTGRYGRFILYRWTEQYQNPPWFVPLWVLAHIKLFRPYRKKLDVSAGKSKLGRYQKKKKNTKYKKTQKSFVFVITATHHHVASHSHVSSNFHFVNRSLPTCFSFFFLASSLLRSLFFFNFLASLFFGFSSFERLVYLVLDARVPLPREYTEVIKWVKIFQNFQTYLQVPTCPCFNFF